MHLFTKLSADLTHLQKQLLDIVWNHHLETGKPYTTRSLQIDLGKIDLSKLLEGVSGSIIFETMENNARCYRLSLLGSLLSGHGSFLFSLLVRFFDFIKQTYERDRHIQTLDSAATRDHLHLSDQDMHYLYRLLSLGLPPHAPVSLSSMQPNGTWSAYVTDHVTELYLADDTMIYLDKLLSDTYDSTTPSTYNARLRHLVATTPPPIGNAVSPTEKTSRTSDERFRSQFVSRSRIIELQALKSKEFDLSRLVRMCEELVDCAEHENAHAVIMLTRAILDHVPPIFGFKAFSRVANNYGDKSFKDAMSHLENGSRRIADLNLHTRIRTREALPNMTQVGFSGPLDLLLSEIVRKLGK